MHLQSSRSPAARSGTMLCQVGDTEFMLCSTDDAASHCGNPGKEEDFNVDVDLLSGMKVWECSKDLVLLLQKGEYLHKPLANSVPRSVLELGAGHGLPGLYCLKHAQKVAFHDNSEAVLQITRANAIACAEHWNKKVPAQTYYKGPWESLECGEPHSYDLILCSEGIYKCEAFPMLFRLLETYLSPQGCALVAAKRFYFGCGGGTRPFLNGLPPTLTGKVAAVYEDGQSNIREILEVQISKNEATVGA